MPGTRRRLPLRKRLVNHVVVIVILNKAMNGFALFHTWFRLRAATSREEWGGRSETEISAPFPTRRSLVTLTLLV